MRVAYVDCFCGISGDIFLGMILDAGVAARDLERELRRVPVRGWSLARRRVRHGAVACTQAQVRLRQRPKVHERRAGEILRIVRAARIAPRARQRALEAFRRLAEAEGAVHGIPPSQVHFHEVGAVDSIVDVIGTCVGLELLGVDRLFCSPVPIARGTIRMEHGILPNPGPATLRLLRGFPTLPLPLEHEIVTPTGAALLSALVEEPGILPAMTIERIGYGAGSWDLPERPNFARIWIGPAARGEQADLVWQLETNLDDATGQEIGHLVERLFEAGALDVWTTAASGKKSRPTVVVGALAEPDRREAVERVFLRESSTFGVRRHLVERTKLARSWRPVRTRYGVIRMKIGSADGISKAQPEYEDVARAARRHGVPLAQVAREAQRDFLRR